MRNSLMSAGSYALFLHYVRISLVVLARYKVVKNMLRFLLFVKRSRPLFFTESQYRFYILVKKPALHL